MDEKQLEDLLNKLDEDDYSPVVESDDDNYPMTTQSIVSNSLIEPSESDASKEEPDEFEQFVLQNAVDLTNLVIDNCKEDRDKVTEVITMIENLIHSQDKIIHGGSIGRLIQAIDTRSNINATVVKVLESQAKILSARKGPSKNTINNNNAVGGDALIALLESGIKNK
jgi:hypothetical protein